MSSTNSTLIINEGLKWRREIYKWRKIYILRIVKKFNADNKLFN